MRRKARTPARTFRPSSPFPLEWLPPSCPVMIIRRKRNRGAGRALVAIAPLGFVKNGDEHRRNILEDVLRFRAIENGSVLPQLVGHLINNELPAVREGFVGFFQKRPFLFDRQNAERNPGKN